MYKRIKKYLKHTKLLTTAKFGFRRGHSTEHALLSLVDRVFGYLNNKESVLLISIDLLEAFDVINHLIMIDKLGNAVIRGFMLDWFRSYLNMREHHTHVNGITSNFSTANTGVSHGSSL